MKKLIKSAWLAIFVLGVYILITTAFSTFFCWIFGLPFDFFVSLAFWFFLPTAAVCVLFMCEGG